MSQSHASSDLRPIHSDPGTATYLRQMWRRRHLALAIPMEEIRVSHQNTLLGNVWHLGNPVLTVGVYYVIFGRLLGVDRGVENFILWLTIGVFTYHLTTKTVQAGARSISGNQGLMRSIRFPRALLPVSVVVEHLLKFAFELAILAAVALLTGEGVSMRWLALPVVVALHSCLNLGGAFITARLNDAFQDVQQLIPFIFRIGTYISGVIVPVTRISDSNAPEWLKTLVLGNPIVTLLDLYRWCFMGTTINMGYLASTIVISIALLVFGFRFFRAAESRYGRA